MAYKKYIKKNGKVYGPYIYHSRRVNGKVISEYRGTKEKKSNPFVYIIGAVFLIAIAFTLFYSKPALTGQTILGISSIDLSEENSSGEFYLELKRGELLPADSKITLTNNENSYEFSLQEIAGLQTETGNYYIENSDISGEGDGIGVEGIKETIVPVEVEYIIISEEIEETTENTNEESNETTEEEQNSTEKNVTGETPVEEPIIEETDENQTTSPLTGTVISEGTETLTKSIRKGRDFTIQLNEGEEIEVVSLTSEGEEIPLNYLTITYEGDEAILTTDYSIIESGFGEEFLGETQRFYFNAEQLGINLEEGNLSLSGSYNNQDLFSVESEISKENPIKKEPEKPEINLTEENKTAEANQTTNETTETNETVYVAPEIEINELTQEEKDLLNSEFPNEAITLKSSKYRDKVLVEFKYSYYFSEKYYSEDISQENLEKLIERDKNIFLRDIINSINSEAPQESSYEDFNSISQI